MSDQDRQNQKPKNPKRTKKRVWLAAIILVIAVIFCLLLWDILILKSKSVDEQLAAIEAARAIPDSENAAVIYNELLAIGSPKLPDSLGQLEWITRRHPWTGKDYPQLADWIESHEQTMTRLLEATKLKECRFPIPADVYAINTRPLATIRQWAFLLSRAACKDLGEGRIDAAIEKHLATVQLGRHICQQPVFLEYIIGTAVEELGLQGLYRMLIETDLTETQIKVIEQFQPTTRENWADISADIIEIERLLSKRTYHPLARLQAWWSDISVKSSLEHIPDNHLWIVSRRRALRIIIELRRHKNRHGHWPETLDEIKSSLPEEALLDPVNGGSFTYKLAGETFKLYSKGQNNIDEDGRYVSEHVPNTLQVRIKQDDILLWPPREPKMKKEDTDPNQPDTSTEPVQ